LDIARGADAYVVPAAPIWVALRDRRVIVFIVAWFGVNLLFGVGTVPIPGVEQGIAWQAHIGGFLAGFILFALFDPVVAPQPFDDSSSDEQPLDARRVDGESFDGSPGREPPPTLH